MKKILFVSFLIVFLLSALTFSFAQAKIIDSTGKVEVFLANQWQGVRSGMTVPTGTVISTGFNSTATVQVGYSSIDVRPLTRMSIAQYVENESSATTSVDLKIGRVRASVRSAEGVSHNFSIKSSTSTASVRGTEFEYDGYEVEVTEGRVAVVFDDTGAAQLVLQGEISGGETKRRSSFDVETNPDTGSALPPVADVGATDLSATLVVTVQ